MAPLDLQQRAARLMALGDPIRLAIVDDLVCSDRSPVELRRRFDLESNLLAHHLDVLERAGMIDRSRSSGDGRRRYVHLRPGAFDQLLPGPRLRRSQALFVCSANSARSQLAAALWTQATGAPAASAGTHPADRVHPAAVAAGKRAGLDLSSAEPTALDQMATLPPLVITVCDRAHEELEVEDDWHHWSVADPVPVGTADAFDAALEELRDRINAAVTMEELHP